MRLFLSRHELLAGWFLLGAIALAAAGVGVQLHTSGLIGASKFAFVVGHGQGLQPGAPVLLQGIQVGEVAAIDLTEARQVRVTCRIAAPYAPFLRKDARASVVVPPLLGSPKVELEAGTSTEAAEPGQQLEAAVQTGFMERVADMERRLDGVVRRADEFAVQATETLGRLREALERFDRSEGLIGQLLHDPELAREGREAVAALNRVATRLEAEALDPAVEAARAGSELARTLAAEDGDLRAVLREGRAAIAQLDSTVVAADLVGTTATLRETLDSLQRTSQRWGEQAEPTGERLQATLAAMREASDALRRLSAALERQPDAVLFGRQPAPGPGVGR